MAKHALSSSNQKRYFASFYLEAIENTKKDSSVLNQKALLCAHQESCLFHLVSAYRCFIWEVANTYDEPYDGYISLHDFLHTAQENGKFISELNQVYQLETTQGSWLQQMLCVWARINQVNPASTSKVKEAVNLNAIEVRVMADVDEFAQLHDWYDNLSKLIDEIRALLSEW
jgi:hypothetical protein